MTILNNRKFAESNKEFTSSLFEKGGTCEGSIKRLKHQLFIFNMHHEIVGHISKYGAFTDAPALLKSYFPNWTFTERCEDLRRCCKSHALTSTYETAYTFK